MYGAVTRSSERGRCPALWALADGAYGAEGDGAEDGEGEAGDGMLAPALCATATPRVGDGDDVQGVGMMLEGADVCGVGVEWALVVGGRGLSSRQHTARAR